MVALPDPVRRLCCGILDGVVVGMTKLTDYDLHEALIILRQRARHPGATQLLWDLILDTEALLKGRCSVMSREEIERKIERELQVN
jgi:hypothetical protein